MPARLSDRAGFALLCLAAMAAVATLPPEAAVRFSGYGFGLPPLVLLALSGGLGVAALAALRRAGFFAAGDRPAGAGLIRAAAIGSALALPAVLVDLLEPFPATMNVAFPAALVFYPAIALVAEAAFHLVPLALVFAIARLPLAAMIAAASVEPLFQTAFAAPGAPLWQTGFVALQVFVIGLAQLWLLRRHGLAALLALRLVYYLWWHIVWGTLRLDILF